MSAQFVELGSLYAGSPPIDIVAAVGRVYLGPSGINVGKDRAFKDIQSAWNSLIGKMVLSPTKILVDEGTYQLSSTLWLNRLPTPHLITVEGSLANPSSVVLDGDSLINAPLVQLNGQGAAGVTFQGFTVTGSPGASACIFVGWGAYAILAALELRGCKYGLQAVEATVSASSARVTAQVPIYASRARIDIVGATLVGMLASSSGIHADFDSVVILQGITSFLSVAQAVYCAYGGRTNMDVATYDANVTYKFVALDCLQACGPFGTSGAYACKSGTVMIPT